MCKYVDEYLLRDEVRAMTSSSSEPALIAEQLRRAFEGDAWHGPAVLELIEGLDAATAAAKPLPDVHSIWELLLTSLSFRTGQLKTRGNEPLPTRSVRMIWW